MAISEIITNLVSKGYITTFLLYDGKQVKQRILTPTVPIRKIEGGIRETEEGYSEKAKDNNTLINKTIINKELQSFKQDLSTRNIHLKISSEINDFLFKKIQFEKDPFNSYQNFLYKRALFGLSVYQKDELEKMHWDKKRRIEKVHQRAQKSVVDARNRV